VRALSRITLKTKRRLKNEKLTTKNQKESSKVTSNEGQVAWFFLLNKQGLLDFKVEKAWKRCQGLTAIKSANVWFSFPGL